MSARAIGALALLTTTVACTPEVPASPTYTNDVQPIFIAHCVRCHGAGDMLHAMLLTGGLRSPRLCYLQRYDNEGDCSNPNDLTTCKPGAGFSQCVGLAASYVTAPSESPMRMPPAPSDPLTDWEVQVIAKWATGGAPR